MNAEQLEELMEALKSDDEHKSQAAYELLLRSVESLARRVIAAEKLVQAAEKASNLIEGSRAFDAAMEELVECAMAYREASK